MFDPRANEIRELVKKLGSRSKTTVDSARARLSIIGSRAVDDLVEALEGDDNRVRARVMPLLALIQDPRGREPLVAMLLDRSVRLREIAARCLGRFPSPETVASLGRLIDRERGIKVRVSAVHSLVDHYATEQEQALGPLLEILADTEERTEVRLAAFAVLPLIRASERRGILARLGRDSDVAIRRHAEQTESERERDTAHETDAASMSIDLASSEYSVWNEAIQELAACGARAIPAILGEMQSRAHDPEYCARAGMALKAIGPRRCGALAEALQQIEEPLPLQVIVEVIGALGNKSLIYRLEDLIERLAARPTPPAETDGFDLMQRVQAKAHLELARIGSRVAIGDLRNCLGDPERRVDLEMVGAIELIGKREELSVLLRAYQREDAFTRDRIGAAVRAIMKRERIRRNSRIFQSLSVGQVQALREILPPPASRPGRRAARGSRSDAS